MDARVTARLNQDPHDGERYPTLSEAGRAMLQRMREHPAAPRYRNQSGNRLLAEEVQQLRGYEDDILGAGHPTAVVGCLRR